MASMQSIDPGKGAHHLKRLEKTVCSAVLDTVS